MIKQYARALGMKEQERTSSDNEHQEMVSRELQQDRDALLAEQAQSKKELEVAEKELEDLAAAVRELSGHSAAEQDVEQLRAHTAEGATSELSGDELELHLGLLVKELQRGEESCAYDAKAWEEKARKASQAAERLRRKLAAYPRRFTQTLEDVREEVRQLQDHRDALERSAREERNGLIEKLGTARTDLSELEAELRRVKEELTDVERDRGFWQARVLKVKGKTDMAERTRAALLQKLKPMSAGRAIEKVCYDKVSLLAAGLQGLEAPDLFSAYVSAISSSLDEFYGPEVEVNDVTVASALQDVCGENRLPHTFEQFCGVCDEIRMLSVPLGGEEGAKEQ